MNLQEIKTALKRYGFDTSDPIMTWINAALHNIESYEDWDWLNELTTVAVAAGSSSFTAPVDALKTQSLRDMTNNNKLVEYERTRFDREIFDPTVTGNPSLYVVEKVTTFHLYPVPDSDVTIQVSYFKTLSDLADDDSSVPPIPVLFHYPIVLNAAYIGLMAESEEERADQAMKQYEASMERAAARYEDQTDDEPQSVVDVQGYIC